MPRVPEDCAGVNGERPRPYAWITFVRTIPSLRVNYAQKQGVLVTTSGPMTRYVYAFDEPAAGGR